MQRGMLLTTLVPLLKLCLSTRTGVRHTHTGQLYNERNNKQHTKGFYIHHKGEHKFKQDSNNKLRSGTHHQLYSGSTTNHRSGSDSIRLCTSALTLLHRQLLLFHNVLLQWSVLHCGTVQLPNRQLHKPAGPVPRQLRILQRKLLRHNTVLLRQRKVGSRRKATGDVIDQLYNELDRGSGEYHKSGSDREPHTCRSKRISRANGRLTYHQLLQDYLVV